MRASPALYSHGQHPDSHFPYPANDIVGVNLGAIWANRYGGMFDHAIPYIPWSGERSCSRIILVPSGQNIKYYIVQHNGVSGGPNHQHRSLCSCVAVVSRNIFDQDLDTVTLLPRVISYYYRSAIVQRRATNAQPAPAAGSRRAVLHQSTQQRTGRIRITYLRFQPGA